MVCFSETSNRETLHHSQFQTLILKMRNERGRDKKALDVRPPVNVLTY